MFICCCCCWFAFSLLLFTAFCCFTCICDFTWFLCCVVRLFCLMICGLTFIMFTAGFGVWYVVQILSWILFVLLTNLIVYLVLGLRLLFTICCCLLLLWSFPFDCAGWFCGYLVLLLNCFGGLWAWVV